MSGADLNKLSPAALSAAMRGGTEQWGQWASAVEHVRYMEPSVNRRRKCHCGCGGRITRTGKANGIALYSGCEMSVARWVKDPANLYRMFRRPTSPDPT